MAKKCCLFAKKLTYLGHVVSAESVATNSANTAAENISQSLRMSLKYALFSCYLYSYYRRFIRNFSCITKCFHTLTEKGTGIKWTTDYQSALDTLKPNLTNAPTLGHPDFKYHFILDTGASNVSIGAVLSQNIDKTERVVAYASKTLIKSEQRSCVKRNEFLRLYILLSIFDSTYAEVCCAH